LSEKQLIRAHSQVHPHDHFQSRPFSLLHTGPQSPGILLRLVDIVDTARPDNDEQPRKRISALDDGRCGPARGVDRLVGDGWDGEVVSEQSGGDERVVLGSKSRGSVG
jgi:hypothetical protein